MHRQHLITTAEALQRVFFPLSSPHHVIQAPKAPVRLQIPTTHHQRRHASFINGRMVPPTNRLNRYGPANDDRTLRDEAIKSPTVHVVSSDGSLNPPRPLSYVLSSFDRSKYFLVQVSPSANENENINANEIDIPVCKIIDRVAARKAEHEKRKPVKNASTMTKVLELSWAIGPNDLAHRMNKMREFLDHGRRVEIVIAVKKKGRTVEAKEAGAVVRKIRETVESIEGAKEWKEMQGVPGTMVTMFIDGKAKKTSRTPQQDQSSPAQSELEMDRQVGK